MNRKNIYISLLVVSIFMFTSCEDWLDVNSDPSNPQEAPAEVLLPPMFQEMVRGDAYDSRYIGSYIQNWSRITANNQEDLHGYYAGSDNIGEKWRQHYYGIGVNIDLMIEDAEANQKWWYVGAAHAIRAWSWQTSTDVYGEMILEQAFEPNRYVFDYDTQDKIYAEVVRLCNLALEYFDKDDVTNTFSRGDLVYAGNRDKWKKFVYAILARNAHHLSNKSSYNPDAVIAFVEQAMTANTDNFNVPHTGTTTDNSNFFGPLRNFLDVTTGINPYRIRQTQYVINLVNGTVFSGIIDPRMPLMFQPSTDTQYRGGVNGQIVSITGATGIPSLYGKYIFTNNAPLPLFTYAEMQFIKAEAAFKKGDLATALTAYQNGIRAHMDYTNVSAANRDAYMASAAVVQTTGALTLSHIMLQKYIAMWGHGVLETWVDIRRYNYDAAVYTGFVLPNPLFSFNNGYPAYRARPRFNSEYMWNIKALEAIGATATDYHTKKPWFITPE